MDKELENDNEKYIIVRSSSTVLASASNKLSTWVSIKINENWHPHGSPQIHNDGDKYFIIQAMIKN